MESSTQVLVGNIPSDIKAKELASFLEANVGIVWRCRIKKTCPPYNAYPEFSSTELDDTVFPHVIPCIPHAFVHFTSEQAAEKACMLAKKQNLVVRGQALKVQLSTEEDPAMKKGTCWKLSNVSVELGTLISANVILVSWKGPVTGVRFEMEQAKKRCNLYLTQWTLFSSLETAGEKMWMRCSYKLEFFVGDLWEVRRENELEGEGTLVMILHFRIPPRIFYRTADDDVYNSTSFELPDDDDPWIRTLDFTPNNSIGRCHAYRIGVSPRQRIQFQKIIDYFNQQQLLRSEEQPKMMISYEVPSVHHRSKFFFVQNDGNLPFEIMFLVNALVHKGIVKAPNLNNRFFKLLHPSAIDIKLAVFSLRHMYSYRKPVFDAEKRLKRIIDWVQSKKLPTVNGDDGDVSMEVGRFIVTPTKAYCLPSETERSNRVLRKFKHLADRFLRVSFVDENFHKLSGAMLNATVVPFARTTGHVSRSALYQRIRVILKEGFKLCGRHYEFLAFSSNQLRDSSAWFFAATKETNSETIRTWMGRFSKTNIAKYASRMGQCFSSTIQTVPVTSVKMIDDVIRNGYNFSDGVGKISPMLALDCARILKLENNPPSAYQIRYAGCKGVVVTWPSDKEDDRILTLRDSMKKFVSKHEYIEVVAWSKFLPCFLNRQIITLLSALTVPNSVFLDLQDSMVSKLDQVLQNSDVAFEVLSSFCSGDLHNTALEMLRAGFHPLGEPHLYSMLHCIRASHLEELLSKARIYVRDGRWLLGCMDELGILEYGQCFVQVSTPQQDDCLPENLLGMKYPSYQARVITGRVIMVKNPCLHPGDVRILEAVDHPALHHLVDCLVMPQTGDRPHSNEASGSDMDGDVYFVCWDPSLIPPEGKSWEPMQYTAHEVASLRHNATVKDVVEFFVRYMANDHLGQICNAHVVHADQSELGALDPKCLELAELAAVAVDSPKTGKLVILPSALRPKAYPDFMDKEDKESYRSKKILGILYRRVRGTAEKEMKLSSFLGNAEFSIEQSYDPDLKIDGYEEYVREAWHFKQMHDVQLGALMDQFDVSIEGEVVTGHFTTILSKHNSRKRGDLKERIINMYTSLRNKFRQIFIGRDVSNLSEAERKDLEESLERKASAWYYVTYHPDSIRKMKEIDQDNDLLLSFPWIAVEYLAKIKLRKTKAYEAYYKMIQSFEAELGMG
ncbi:hypothetical protein KP509_14G029700 [Ceratopteris richardii]|uniref:RNA-dependent RNA polymerase n=1 Tax=Ceratopteris richardii TaxID=49495 RepID=A0A8T2TDF2_CERRI|nr:hypothetical protein KP509_14G029700 [Ceratopteris richardii]KAH7415136.1 hypothetical protein KP509_14G029700 [Ceratopteris richardii]KAH7415137.1 hypothetical protein KP509_14G029700 [Ceratopteris richardii]KAH7415138.1 hypothetical protein KP509_14G029700 [Ceratopteris richardii]KAH7415139.1 hypothetical protein KP509_14G029700 [Ceratopteris richardii]